MIDEIEKHILKILIFFDLSGYAPSALELYKWMEIKISFKQCLDALQLLQSKNVIGQKNGCYFVSGKEKYAERKATSYQIANGKFKRALKMISIMRHFPWIRAMGVYGSLALSNSTTESDIDLFIFAQGSRLWSARFFINSFLKIFNLRPTPQTGKDKFCVSYFISDTAMDIGSIIVSDNRMFYSTSIGQFMFLYQERDEERRFFAANEWLRQSFPQWDFYRPTFRRHTHPKGTGIKKFLESACGLIPDEGYEKFQRRILPDNLKYTTTGMTDVIINNCMLKLHSSNRSRGFEQRYNEQVNTFFNAQN